MKKDMEMFKDMAAKWVLEYWGWERDGWCLSVWLGPLYIEPSMELD